MTASKHQHSGGEGGLSETAETGIPEPIVSAARQAHAAMQALLETVAHEIAGRELAAIPIDRESLPWSSAMAPADLAEAAVRLVAAGISEPHAFASGRVHCYACGTNSCQHAGPTACGDVFTGYESTGRPRWEGLFNCLLELGDTRTDLLFDARPQLLARVVGRQRLIAQQLASFGRNALTYRVWGQVVAGYLQVQDSRCALTAQVVEDSQHRLHLQVIASPLLMEALAGAPEDERSAFHRVHDALREARRQTASLATLWHSRSRQRETRVELREKAFVILRHLANSIERKGRQQQRRTMHAERRGAQQRPVHKAYDDVMAATAQDMYVDRYRNSVIVAGRAGRIHAFSNDGKHITSLVLEREEFERRVARQRYVPLAAAETDAFRAGVLAALPLAEGRAGDADPGGPR